jgi:hypothetical protein
LSGCVEHFQRQAGAPENRLESHRDREAIIDRSRWQVRSLRLDMTLGIGAVIP